MLQDRLIDIAIREFGEKGLDGASTRGIAGAADTAMSSITYHYGGKEGLYLAAADHIAEQMSREMLSLLDLEDPVALADAAAARAKIHYILCLLIDRMLGEKSAAWSMFIIREQLLPGAAFDRIYDKAMGRLLGHLVDLVCVATGVSADAQIRVAVFLMTAQVFALRSARGVMLRLAGEDGTVESFTNSLKHEITLSTNATLDRLTTDRQETA